MYKLLKLNLARNSLRYLIRTYNIQELYLPYYLCNVIFKSVTRENCKIKFYHIDDNFFPQHDFSNDDFILYPNYFGICDKNTDILAKKYKNIIIDSAHAFYFAPKGLATFNSARKFINVNYGSYLWTKMINKNLTLFSDNYINQEIDKIKSENNFANFDIKLLDKKTESEILSVNEKDIRKKIFIELHKKYNGENMLKINPDECTSPFCYPFLAKDNEYADTLANELTNSGYDIFRYWTPLPENYNEYKFFRRLVPIPLKNF